MAKGFELSSLVVRDAAGAVDMDASVDAFRDAVLALELSAEEDQASIGVALEQLFDAHKGLGLSMKYVPMLVCQSMQVAPEQLDATCEKVVAFIKAHSDVYSITKGPGGGCRRIADIPSKATK